LIFSQSLTVAALSEEERLGATGCLACEAMSTRARLHVRPWSRAHTPAALLFVRRRSWGIGWSLYFFTAPHLTGSDGVWEQRCGVARDLRARLEGGRAGAVRYVGRIGKIALEYEQGPWDGVAL